MNGMLGEANIQSKCNENENLPRTIIMYFSNQYRNTVSKVRYRILKSILYIKGCMYKKENKKMQELLEVEYFDLCLPL